VKRSTTSSLVFALAQAAAFSAAACGGGVASQESDASQVITPVAEGGLIDGTTTGPDDGGIIGYDVSIGPNGDGGVAGGGEGGNAVGDASGGAPVDAGYYYGDGSFWVEGGAYPSLPDASDQGGPDAAVDAAPGCGPLAACCGALTGATQTLCNTVVGAGNATSCAAELTQLQSGGYCSGSTILATQVQVPANRIVSDGTLLYWTTFESSPGLMAMPVQGGTITTLLSAQTANAQGGVFLAVDDVCVYVLEGYSLVRIPKNGAPPTLINEAGATVFAATSLGATAYWLEAIGQNMPNQPWVVKSAPLQGGSVSVVATFTPQTPTSLSEIAVTSHTAFVGMLASGLFYFPLSGANSLTMANESGCGYLASDTDAIYCPQTTGSNLRITSADMSSVLGQAVSSSFIVTDDTYAYWVDQTTVGTILKAPKTGGGSATVIATDTNPTAIAVDANSIYWSDQEGYIKSVPK
jgi:hypothetical protein